MNMMDKINDKFIKHQKFFEITMLAIIGTTLVISLYNLGFENFIIKYLPIALQIIYAAVLIVGSSYMHELGHYMVIKKFYPKTDSKFVWTTYFNIPIPYIVQTKNFNGTLTAKKSIAMLIAGPILGFIPIIFSYHILLFEFFMFLVFAELLACKSDFEKIYIIFKEWREGTVT